MTGTCIALKSVSMIPQRFILRPSVIQFGILVVLLIITSYCITWTVARTDIASYKCGKVEKKAKGRLKASFLKNHVDSSMLDAGRICIQ